MGTNAVQRAISHALTDQSFRLDLLKDPAIALDSRPDLGFTRADFTADEVTALSQLREEDLLAMAALKRDLPDTVAAHTGGVIL